MGHEHALLRGPSSGSSLSNASSSSGAITEHVWGPAAAADGAQLRSVLNTWVCGGCGEVERFWLKPGTGLYNSSHDHPLRRGWQAAGMSRRWAAHSVAREQCLTLFFSCCHSFSRLRASRRR